MPGIRLSRPGAPQFRKTRTHRKERPMSIRLEIFSDYI